MQQKKQQTISDNSENNIGIILKKLQKQRGTTMLNKESKREKNKDLMAFRVLISTALSARSKDETTEAITPTLYAKYPTPKLLAQANVQDIEKLIKKTGFYKVKARRIIAIANIIHNKYRDSVPSTMDELVAIPGVGRKTAGCVLVYAFNKSAIPVDTHVHRISNRLGLVNTQTPRKTEEKLLKIIPEKYWMHINECFVLHGKTICKPITPQCEKCPITTYCKYYKDKQS